MAPQAALTGDADPEAAGVREAGTPGRDTEPPSILRCSMGDPRPLSPARHAVLARAPAWGPPVASGRSVPDVRSGGTGVQRRNGTGATGPAAAYQEDDAKPSGLRTRPQAASKSVLSRWARPLSSHRPAVLTLHLHWKSTFGRCHRRGGKGTKTGRTVACFAGHGDTVEGSRAREKQHTFPALVEMGGQHCYV